MKEEKYLFIFEDMEVQIRKEVSDDDKNSVDCGYLTIVRQSDFKEWSSEGWITVSVG